MIRTVFLNPRAGQRGRRRCGGGRKRGPGFNLRYAWPSAESGSLPAAGRVMAAYRRIVEAMPDPEAMRTQIEDRLNALASVMRRPQLADEIIDPRDTRPVTVAFVRAAQSLLASQLDPKLHAGMRPGIREPHR